MIMNADYRKISSKVLGKDKFTINQFNKYEKNDFFLLQSEAITYDLVIDKTTHGSFSDFGIFTQNIGQWTGLSGKIKPWAMKTILDDYTLAFFNKHIKGLEETLLNDYSKNHPEVVKFKVRKKRVE